MSERDNQISERLKVLLPRLSDQDKRVLMAYGEGMADKAARIMTQIGRASCRERVLSHV